MFPETEIINALAPKPTWFRHANTVILQFAQKRKLWAAATATKRGTDFQQRVRGFTVHANHSVSQSAAEPKHAQQTEQNRKLTDRRECLIRLFLGWRGSRSHCNNIVTTATRSNLLVILFLNQFASSLKNNIRIVRILVWKGGNTKNRIQTGLHAQASQSLSNLFQGNRRAKVEFSRNSTRIREL